jgi:hypothetical protein
MLFILLGKFTGDKGFGKAYKGIKILSLRKLGLPKNKFTAYNKY